MQQPPRPPGTRSPWLKGPPGRVPIVVALASIVMPLAAFFVSLGMALTLRGRAREDPRYRAPAERLIALAAVDALVLVALVALATGRAPMPAPGPAPSGPRIGILLDPDSTDEGPRVLSVVPDSPAERAGVLADDVVVAVDGAPVRDAPALQRSLHASAEGQSRSVAIVRDGRRLELDVTPAVLAPAAPLELFEPITRSVPFLRTFTDVLWPWLASMGLAAAACAWVLRRPRPATGAAPSPLALWLLLAGLLAATAAATVALQLGLTAALGGVSVGVALLSVVGASGVLAALAVGWWWRLGWRGEPDGASTAKTFVAGIGYLFAGVPRAGLIVVGLAPLLRLSLPDPKAVGLEGLAGAGLGPGGWALWITGAVVLAPIGEEILFRGILLPWLARSMPATAAIVVSAAIFGLGHLRYGPYLLITVVYGLVFGWARVRTGKLRTSIGLHMLVNGAITVFAMARA